MGNINNPAGRLHTLLSDFREQADKQRNPHATWCHVLGVADAELLPELAEVAALIPAIRQAVEQSGQEEQAELFRTFSRAWTAPVVAADYHPRQQPGPGPDLVNPQALAALGGLSAFLSAVSPEGAVPDEGRQKELRDEVEGLLRDLVEDRTLPPALAQAINFRLHDILWAIDHVRIGGPGAVEAAAERLLGQIALHSNAEARESGFYKKAMKVLGQVWVAYKAGPEAHAALEGWQDILGALPPGN